MGAALFVICALAVAFGAHYAVLHVLLYRALRDRIPERRLVLQLAGMALGSALVVLDWWCRLLYGLFW